MAVVGPVQFRLGTPYMSNSEKPKFITKEGESVFESERPADAEEKLKIQERRDAALAKALLEGDPEKIREVREMPDEAFARGKIIEFPKREEEENKETA